MTRDEIEASAGRVETGVVQFDDDWPGVFIRGDNALMGYLPALKRLLNGDATRIDVVTLEGLERLLASCRAGEAVPRVIPLTALSARAREAEARAERLRKALAGLIGLVDGPSYLLREAIVVDGFTDNATPLTPLGRARAALRDAGEGE